MQREAKLTSVPIGHQSPSPTNADLGNKWSQFPGLAFAFPFEENFDLEYHKKWFQENWTISIFISIVYIVLLMAGTTWMKTREKFDLRKPLALWSFGLTIFSFCASVRFVPELLYTVWNKGWVASCIDNSFVQDNRMNFWIWMFVWSKAPELVDTAFIVLRKQKLIFLHYFHHFLTLTFCFMVFHEMSGIFRWMAGMNCTIHTFMYGYYTLKALRVQVPSFFAILITTSQITQMVVGFTAMVTLAIERSKGKEVNLSEGGNLMGLCLYGSFLVLFANFFVHTYIIPSCSSSANKKEETMVITFNNNQHLKKK